MGLEAEKSYSREGSGFLGYINIPSPRQDLFVFFSEELRFGFVKFIVFLFFFNGAIHRLNQRSAKLPSSLESFFKGIYI